MGGRKKSSAIDDEHSLLSVKSDFVFRLIFGDKRNNDILRAFLIAALDIPADAYDVIEIVDPHLKQEFEDDKLGILDVLVKTKSGEQIDIEIQVSPVPAMPERVAFYTSKLLTSQIAEGDEYVCLKKVIGIVILDYSLIKDSTAYHNKYKLHDRKTDSTFTDILEIHTMELPKLPQESDDDLFNWLKFISSESEEEFEMIATKNPKIGRAYAVLKRLSSDERVRMQYAAREKALRDERSRIRGAREEGMELGRVEGEAKGRAEGEAKGRVEGEAKGREEEKIAMARTMLALGADVEFVSKASGLSPEAIERLR